MTPEKFTRLVEIKAEHDELLNLLEEKTIDIGYKLKKEVRKRFEELVPNLNSLSYSDRGFFGNVLHWTEKYTLIRLSVESGNFIVEFYTTDYDEPDTIYQKILVDKKFLFSEDFIKDYVAEWEYWFHETLKQKEEKQKQEREKQIADLEKQLLQLKSQK